MKYLSINTAGKSTEIALVYGDKVLTWCDNDFRRASEILLPQIDKMLIELNITLNDLDFFACVIGPGSFTGIRIGVSTIRVFCYALKKKALTVNYLNLIAYNENADGSDRILSVVDGSNGTAYIRTFDNLRIPLSDCACVLQSELPQIIDDERVNCVVLDEGMQNIVADNAFSEKICTVKQNKPCESLMRAVENLAGDSSNLVDFNFVQPLYIRVSQAEADLIRKKGVSYAN